jgi:hypothetical protein
MSQHAQPHGHSAQWVRFVLLAAAIVVVAAAFDRLWGRPWRQHWGATPGEVARAMPGDDRLTMPDEVTTRAITIRARPEQVWPWLAQMGRGRGGLYSYDWLDQWFGVLDAPSATRVLPEFQQIAPGDTIPVGGSAGWPVAIAQPGETLLLDVNESGVRVTWVFTLEPVGAGATRLVTPTEFIMVRRQLLNLRERAERGSGPE